MRIECKKVSREFVNDHSKSVAVKDVSFVIESGQSVAIWGASGAGKSSLISMIGTLDRPTGGGIFLNGKDLSLLSDVQRAELRNQSIGFVFQFHHLLKDFTVFENVAMPLWIRGEKGTAVTKRVQQVLSVVGLEQRKDSFANELSGGESQRIAVARAVVHKPSLILADEPTGNLDESNSDKVFELLCQLNRDLQSTLVMVTHHQGFAARLQKRLVMEQGHLVESAG